MKRLILGILVAVFILSVVENSFAAKKGDESTRRPPATARGDQDGG